MGAGGATRLAGVLCLAALWSCAGDAGGRADAGPGPDRTPVGEGGVFPPDGGVHDAAGRDAQLATPDAALFDAAGLEPPPAGLTDRQACLRYVEAVCTRREQCIADNDYASTPCLYDPEDCPDLFFSDGSGWTAGGLFTCAQLWASHPCERAVQHELPSCVPPGTRAAGAACLYGAQCAGSLCKQGVNQDCGECVPVWSPGQTCDPSLEGIRCPFGFGCEGGSCVDTVPDPYEPPMEPGLGESCLFSNCVSGFTCVRDMTTDAPTCVTPPGLGDWCKPNDYVWDGRDLCMQGARCDDGYVCVVGPLLGEACTRDADGSSACPPGSFCPSANAGLCEVVHGPGESCLWDLQCSAGLVCPDDPDDPAHDTCVTPRTEGESCADPDTACVGRLSCVAGLCEAPEAPTQFEAQCLTP